MVLARLIVLSLAVCASTAVSVPKSDLAPLSSRANAAQVDTFCARFSKACTAACSNIGIAGEATSVCEAATKSLFDFGCTCSDSTVITTLALKQVTGLTSVKTKTKVTPQTNVVEATRTKTQTTTLVITSTSFSTSQVSSTSTTTSYIYKPSSYPDANRVAANTFSDAFSASCSSVCKNAQSSVKSSSSSLQSSGADSDRYKLTCLCANSDSLTLDALVGVGKKGVKAVTTSTRTVVATSTKYRTVTQVVTEFTTAATLTKNTQAVTTSTSVLPGPTESVQTSLKGRIRVDRTDRNAVGDAVGFYSTILPDPKYQDNPARSEPYLEVDYSVAKAASITMQLEPSGQKNAYAARWDSSNGTTFYSNIVHRINNELGDPNDCDSDNALEWYTHEVAYGPPDDSISNAYGPLPMETYIYTLGASEPNLVNPSRHVQIPLSLLYVTSNGTLFVPSIVLAYGVLIVQNRPNGNHQCEGIVSEDARLWFEPDP